MEQELAKLIDGYQPSADTIALVRRTPIVLLAGIAGTGKNTIQQQLLKRDEYRQVVSHTTRPPRLNDGVLEQDGREYHFIDLATAHDMLLDGKFVEAKFVHGDTVYGTSAAEVARAGADNHIALNDVDIQGIAEYKAISPGVIAIFVLPPNFEEWQRRLRARYSDAAEAEAEIAKRRQTAITELTEATQRDYFHFVINDQLDAAVQAVDKIAHSGNQFNAWDGAVRAQAEQLLANLRAGQVRP